MAKPQMKLGSEPMLSLPPKQSVLEGVKFQPDNFLKDEHNNFEIIQGYNVHTDIVNKIFAETQILKDQFIPNLISNSDINRSSAKSIRFSKILMTRKNEVGNRG